MRGICQSVLLLCLGSMGIQTPDIAARGADEAVQAPREYSSPQEAFQARRTAIARRNWRTSFSSMTLETQDQTVMELTDGWLWLESDLETPWDRLGEAARKASIAKYRAIMKKHGLELQKVEAEYNKRYRELHGVDLDKILAERRKRNLELFEARWKEHPEEREEGEKLLKEHPELLACDPAEFQPGEKPGPDLPEPNMELTAKVISSQLIDKAGLYEEAMEFLTPKVKDPKGGDSVFGDFVFGDLQGVTVSGDTARGWVLWTQYVGVNGVKKANKPVQVLRRFRRLNGRWYNDNREDDLTRYDDPRDR